VRLPALVLVVAAVAAGCSSSGPSGSHRSSGPPVSSDPASTPAAPSSPTAGSATPVASPTAQPSVTSRAVTKPAGATDPGFTACGATSTLIYNDLGLMFTGPTVQSQVQLLPAVAADAQATVKGLASGRKDWLAHGWPASSPLVQDLDRLATLFDQAGTAAAMQNLAPLPQLYVDIKSAQQQFFADSKSAGVCK
jgi:hypothetical protein